MTPCKLIKLQFQKTFQYLLKCGLRMQSQLDFLLFQPIRYVENTLVVPQTSVILSQLQQLQQFTQALQIINSTKSTQKSNIDDDSDGEMEDFDFSKTHLNFQLSNKTDSLEIRVLYMLNLVTQQPTSEIYLLQKLNTVGYVYEYLLDISNQISNLVSQSLKDFTLHFMYSLVQQYRMQIWEPVCRRLKPNLLGEALVNVFQKWAVKRQFGITMLEVQQIKQQITGFQTRKEQINLQAQDENEKIDELSGESTIQGLDIDQVTESGFSVNDTEVQQKFKVNNSKVKSKRIKTIITDNLSQFYKQFDVAMKYHKGFYCISRNLNKKLKQVIEQTAFSQLEFYQNVCYATMVSQRYFEEDQKEGMLGLMQKVKDIFGE
uniref:Uncharacterized protein n=1 Tax=Trepomonas sp. PC1 TaxID=1076344 RepID=A0A146KIT7_9EUKA|eukprot:JAP96563.1 hypothetical protein TPC1_10056 [Trepomonas sp. PC1]